MFGSRFGRGERDRFFGPPFIGSNIDTIDRAGDRTEFATYTIIDVAKQASSGPRGELSFNKGILNPLLDESKIKRVEMKSQKLAKILFVLVIILQFIIGIIIFIFLFSSDVAE